MIPAAGRVRWALVEGLVIAAILSAWLAVRLLFEVADALINLPVDGSLAAALASTSDAVVSLLGPLAIANVALYVAVRAGLIIVDRHAK